MTTARRSAIRVPPVLKVPAGRKEHPAPQSPQQRRPQPCPDTASPTPPMPPARPVAHTRTLLWWLMAVVLALFIQRQPGSEPAVGAPMVPVAGAVEKETFIAFVFGKVSAADSEAIQPQLLRKQLAALRESGAHVIRLRDVRDFLGGRRALPSRPVLLVFDEARRETVDSVDPILAELDMAAAAFVNVPALEQGNVDLVSRRRIGTMVGSGHWDTGINACRSDSVGDGLFHSLEYARHAEELQRWQGGREVLAISCLRDWQDTDESHAMWKRALQKASLQLGFVDRVPGANYREDTPSALRLVRIPGDERRSDALVRRLSAYTPRHGAFADDFRGRDIDGAWIFSQGHASVQGDRLKLTADSEDTAGFVTLGGTDRWTDAVVTVDLDTRPSGQFWIYARHSTKIPFVRLGIVNRRAVLQRSDADGQTRQLAAQDLPPGESRLSLRVVGSRALAMINDQSLLERPAELPDNLKAGPITLAVWNNAGAASATVQRIRVEPLASRVALLDPNPEQEVFENLRNESATLTAVSPRLFSWRSGKAEETASLSIALQILAGHEHLPVLAAVAVDRLPRDKEWARFRKRMLDWAAQPQLAGLNLVTDTVHPEDVARIEELRQALQAHGRQLAVTLIGTQAHLQGAPQVTWLMRAGRANTGFQIAAASLRKEPA